MRVQVEGSDFVVLELSLDEAAHLAADILGQEKRAGEGAVALAHKLAEAGLCTKKTVSNRSEWAGPDDV